MSTKNATFWWSEADIAYLKDHYESRDWELLKSHLGKSLSSIQKKSRALGLKITHKRIKNLVTPNVTYYWPQSDIDVLKANYLTMKTSELAVLLNRSVYAVRQKAHAFGLKLDGRFNESNNRRGIPPWNIKSNGSELMTSHGYIYVRCGGKWIGKHRWVWQQHTGQKIPEGYCIRFIDGNKHNFAFENLELVSRLEHLDLNSVKKYQYQLAEVILLHRSLRRKIHEQ